MPLLDTNNRDIIVRNKKKWQQTQETIYDILMNVNSKSKFN